VRGQLTSLEFSHPVLRGQRRRIRMSEGETGLVVRDGWSAWFLG
jgi:hypothetical protein